MAKFGSTIYTGPARERAKILSSIYENVIIVTAPYKERIGISRQNRDRIETCNIFTVVVYFALGYINISRGIRDIYMVIPSGDVLLAIEFNCIQHVKYNHYENVYW